jgi:hypothetical protein
MSIIHIYLYGVLPPIDMRRLSRLPHAPFACRADSDRLRRQNENLTEVVDARGDHLAVLERKAAFWQKEAMRWGELVDQQTRRIIRLQHERAISCTVQ